MTINTKVYYNISIHAFALWRTLTPNKEFNQMIGRKKDIIMPVATDGQVLVQLIRSVEVSKKTLITVPTHYRAIALVDGKPLFRIEACNDMPFVDTYGKEYIGKTISVAFISMHAMAQTAWGFGNIQVNNMRLKEAYRLGANGKFAIDVVDYTKLLFAFPGSDIITLEGVKEKVLPTIKTVGTALLGEYFSNTEISVFEMSALLLEFRDKFAEALSVEKIFGDMGIGIASLSVDGFHVNEEDLAVIRNRINA